MIGWRPYLFTALALALVAVVVLDVHRSVEQGSPCAAAEALARDGFPADALTQYKAVLKSQPSASCVPAGIAAAVKAECQQAHALATVDPARAQADLVIAVSAEPGMTVAKCKSEAATKARSSGATSGSG